MSGKGIASLVFGMRRRKREAAGIPHSLSGALVEKKPAGFPDVRAF